MLKTYNKILNDRLNFWVEENDLLVPEQLCFRRDASCMEHVMLIYLVTENRKLLGKDTFLCFIDFRKAFDSVNRNLLWYKLQLYGLNGALLNIISHLYKDVRYCVEFNNEFST